LNKKGIPGQFATRGFYIHYDPVESSSLSVFRVLENTGVDGEAIQNGIGVVKAGADVVEGAEPGVAALCADAAGILELGT
jgi:hypothetical protein